MKYSEKYSATNTITLGGINFNTTDKLKNLYTVNEKFDNSILFTSSEILESLNLYPNFNSEYDGGSVYDFFTYVDRTTHKFKNVDKLNSEKLKVGICFIFSQNYSNPPSYFNWGVYTNQSTGVHYDSENFVFIKNIDLKKLVFSASASNIGDFSDIVSDGEGWGKLGTDYISINAYYWDGSRYQTVYLRPAIVIYDNDTLLQVSAIQPILSQNFFGGEFYNNFSQSYLFNTRSNNLKNYEKKSQMIIYPEFDINGIDLTPDTNPNLFKNDYVKLTTTKSSSTTTIDTYLSKSYISKILASIGCYFTDYNLYNDKTKNFDWLLQNGHLWLGEMVDGKTTGKWLHSIRDIYLAENYEINSENENYKPNDVGENDTIENMVDKTIFNYSSSPFTKYYKTSLQHIKDLSNAITTNTPEIPEGLNVFDNIVSLSIFPFDVETYCRSPISDTIKIYNWDSNVSALRIDTQTTNKTLCTINIPRIYNDFRDYTPYTKRTIFLPLYGNYELPNICVGRILKITQNSDIINNSFSYIISIGDNDNQCVIDKIKVRCGSECDFIAINKSIKNISVLQNQLSTANSVIGGIASVTSGNTFGITSSITGIAQSIINTNVSKNTSYTMHTSNNDSVADLLDVSSIYLTTVKSTYLPFDPHSCGYVYNKVDKLSNHSGFAKLENVDIKCNCTLEEQREIKNLLESGIYI